MPPIYPSTALKNQQREIKALADHETVYITENGRGKYVFMSEEVLNKQIEDAVEEALYEQRLVAALREARADLEAGRYCETRAEFMEAVSKIRADNA